MGGSGRAAVASSAPDASLRTAAVSLDSSNSFVEIDSDNATSRSSSHDDTAMPGGRRSVASVNDDDHGRGGMACTTVEADDDDEDDDTVDTKPNVQDFQHALHNSERFLRSNFAAVSMAGGLSMSAAHHHHHHATSHHPATHHSTQHHHHVTHHPHHHHHGLAAAAAAFHSAGYAGGGSHSSCASNSSVAGETANDARSVSVSPPLPAGCYAGGGAGSGRRKASPFLSPAQLYKSLFASASAVLQNPEKMSAAGFPRNLLFSCAAERSTDSESADADEKASVVDEVERKEERQ